MIKSHFSFIGIFLLWYLCLLSLFMLYLTFGIISHLLRVDIVDNNLTDVQYRIILVAYPILAFIALAQVKINGRIVYIDSSNKTITFKNYFTRHQVIYKFSELDGYVGTLKKSPRGDFRIFYLVINNKLANKISGRVYSNIEELYWRKRPLVPPSRTLLAQASVCAAIKKSYALINIPPLSHYLNSAICTRVIYKEEIFSSFKS